MDKLKEIELTKKELLVGLGFSLIGFTGGIILKTQVKHLLAKIGLLGKNKFASINKPVAGAREQKQLPKGEHPIQLYSMGTPNGQKVTVLLEELGLKYDAYHINIMKGDQFGSGFVDINPNSKIPALIDYTENKEEGDKVYESGSILLYLAEKSGKLIPSDPKKRTECLNLLFFQMGSAPYFGQFGHFKNYCPKGFWFDHEYSFERYKMETQRICSVLDMILKDKQYLCGDEYTIADIAWYPWYKCLTTGYNAADILELDTYKNVNRWAAKLEERPAVAKGMTINQPWKGGEPDYHSQ